MENKKNLIPQEITIQYNEEGKTPNPISTTKNKTSKSKAEDLYILPVIKMVVFPHIIVPITAGRDYSRNLLQEAYQKKWELGVLTQKDPSEDLPGADGVFQEGTVVKIIKIIELPEGKVTAIVKGVRSFKVHKFLESDTRFLKAHIKFLTDTQPKAKAIYSALVDNIRDVFKKILDLNNAPPLLAGFALENAETAENLINFICMNADLPTEKALELLRQRNAHKRAELLYENLLEISTHLELRLDIQDKTKKALDKHQKEYILTQQMRTIQEELGQENDGDVAELLEKSATKEWNPEVQAHFEKELRKLEKLNIQSPEYSVQRNYLNFYTDLPWNHLSTSTISITKTKKLLDKEHFGLQDVKERILEYLSVLQLKQNLKAPILCLCGPPGVGKTSLGKSIADSLGRKFIRISLGGLHDESEIRGHRKTYIGAMAGKILQSIKKAGVSNPVVVLDEIDKLGKSMQGDPSSALLEVLDPEQNHEFYDNFLEVSYDLSKVLFIATANTLNTIQSPLLDRMEIIQISGYTAEEKMEIAKNYLVPKQIEENGLGKNAFILKNEELLHIITHYTRESGVRKLNHKIAKIARRIAYKTTMGETFDKNIKTEEIDAILGVPHPPSLANHAGYPGVVTGLAWTSMGGDILFIESILSEGKGNLSMTGNLGDVMKESATIALEYIKAYYPQYGISKEDVTQKNIHIHVPEGATPKDGPSAGIAMFTSIISSFLHKNVKPNIAMTGEITLRGKVLPVGGIKEKILAAKRAGIQEVILCKENKRDVEEIDSQYIKGLTIHYIDQMQEVIPLAIA